MTDKKFSLLSFEYGLFEDNETGKGFDMEKCVDLLNSMYEEKESLKNHIQHQDQHIKRLESEHVRMTGILQKHYNYACEQRQKNLDNAMICKVYDVLRYTVRGIADEYGVDLND